MFYLVCIHYNNILIYKSLFIEYSIVKKKYSYKLEFSEFLCLIKDHIIFQTLYEVPRDEDTNFFTTTALFNLKL